MGADGIKAGLADVTMGNNGVMSVNSMGVTHTLAGFSAGPGYDLASGLGQPWAPTFVDHLAAIG